MGAVMRWLLPHHTYAYARTLIDNKVICVRRRRERRMPVLTLLSPFYPLRGSTCGMVLPTIRVGLPSSAKPVWKCIQRYPIGGSPRIFQFSHVDIELIITVLFLLWILMCVSPKLIPNCGRNPTDLR